MNQEILPNASAREIIHSMNYNVKLTFGFFFTSSLGNGIWMGSVLSLYINIFAQTSTLWNLTPNQVLGLTSAASGVTMTLFVFLAGFLADKFRRDIILKSATIVGIAAMGFILFGTSIIYILIAMLLWGLHNAFVNPSLESIFADSVVSGYRSKMYSWGNLVNQAAMALGPFINIGLFAIFGNNYDLTSLRSVMAIGFAISFISIILLFFFKDERSLGKESEAIVEDITEVNGKFKESRLANLESSKKSILIPVILIIGNIIIGFGAGMTIKFFPVFFKEIYVLKPISIQAIMGATFLATGILGIVAQKISLKLGRISTIFIVQYIATFCLLIIAIYPPLSALILLFIARGSFMNAAQPLSRSIMMDIIPKKNRGKWNSVQSIAWGLFWNVSAFAGGFLIGESNYNLCFTITTFIYCLGLIPVILLIPMVGKELEAKKEESIKGSPQITSN